MRERVVEARSNSSETFHIVFIVQRIEYQIIIEPVSYTHLQHYRIFPSADPYAKDNMIGKGVKSFSRRLLTHSVDNLPESLELDPGYNAQMADKEALKRIEIYNRIYGYAQGDMNYSMQAAVSYTHLLSFREEIRVMSVSAEDVATPANSYKPYQAYLFYGNYPLARSIYALLNDPRSGLPWGFASFMTSDKGQRLILKSGLVPATQPVRIVHVKDE